MGVFRTFRTKLILSTQYVSPALPQFPAIISPSLHSDLFDLCPLQQVTDTGQGHDLISKPNRWKICLSDFQRFFSPQCTMIDNDFVQNSRQSQSSYSHTFISMATGAFRSIVMVQAHSLVICHLFIDNNNPPHVAIPSMSSERSNAGQLKA